VGAAVSSISIISRIKAAPTLIRWIANSIGGCAISALECVHQIDDVLAFWSWIRPAQSGTIMSGVR